MEIATKMSSAISNGWSMSSGHSIRSKVSPNSHKQRHRASKDVKEYIKLILNYIENRNWDAFEKLVLSSVRTFRSTSHRISEIDELNGMSLIHCCVHYDPPLKLLKKMVKATSSSLSKQDVLGRTPLHIAVGSGASEESVRFLVASYPRACGCQDIDGRTPLHFACDSSSQLFEDDDPVRRDPPSYNLVQTLLSGCWDSAALEDNRGVNAIEYALVSKAHMRTIRLLQKATLRQVLREKSKQDTRRVHVHRSTIHGPTSLAARSA
mmetsp:Transcript_17347/g.38395  ORF Transcript_17347/g.38395 Transcript_17347/m.38395 type:complete len:265 (+) Transcript_17347:510-1304(+)